MNTPPTEQETHLSDYIVVLRKRKVVIGVSLLVCVTATMLSTFLTSPIYQSTAKLVIEKETSSSPITGERMDFESFRSQALTFNTHFKLITSTPVLLNLAKKLELDKDVDELQVNDLKKVLKQLKTNIKSLLKKREKIFLPHVKQQKLLETIRKKIKISQISDTRLLTISVKDKSPVRATALANTLANEYIEFNLTNRVESSTATLKWLNNELYTLKKKLEDDERKFFAYKQESEVFSIEGKQNVVEQKIVEFNNKYLETRNKRLSLDATIAELDRHIQQADTLVNVRSLINSPMLDKIYDAIIDDELEFGRLTKLYKAKHPKIVQLNTRIERSKQQFQNELKKEQKSMMSERAVLFSRENTLEKTIAEFEGDALDASSKELNYTILQRNVNTSQSLYDVLVSRVKESNILQGSNSSNIRLVEKGEIPIYPISPKKKSNLLLSVILGLFGGVGLAFFIEYLDQTVRTEEDLKNVLNVNVLSVIPEAELPHTEKKRP